jgi:uncharacterized membrane protein
MSTANRSLLEDAIDVPLWLEADRDTPLALRTERDREIARRMPSDNALASVRAWWSALRPGSDLGARLDRGRRLVGAILAVAGLIAGSGFATVALRYDGTTPVNVVSALAILLGVQSVMLVLTLVMLMPGRFGLAAVQRSLLSLDPAVFAAALYRRLHALPESVGRLFAWHAGRSAANRFAKWQLLAWSQTAAIAFNVGLLATAFALVAATDLAFGWSTTLALSAHRLAAFTDAISSPWRAWLPEAVPGVTLIEETRFFRLEDVAPGTRRAEAFTPWWPFLLLAIVVYGLVPRVLLRALAALRLHAATRALLLEDARVSALLDRMSAPSVQLAAPTAEAERPVASASLAPLDVAVGEPAVAVLWAAALPPDAAADVVARALGVRVVAVAEAGGASSLAEDRRTIERTAAHDARRIVVVTRAWEPPLLELLDFLRDLRSHVGEQTSIVVCPASEPGTRVTAEQVDTWRRTVGQLRDPHLYVEAADVESSA